MSFDYISSWFTGHPDWGRYLALVGVLALSVLSYLAAKLIIRRTLTGLIERSATQWDDILLRRQVFHRLAYIIPVLVLFYFTALLPAYGAPLERLLSAVIAWLVVLVISALLNAGHDIFEHTEFAQRLGLKSYLQVIKLGLYILGLIIVLSLLMGRSPWVLLSGVGALTAVLLLVFRDTLLSFVASLQISSNDLMRVGDWIEVPEFNADGDVIDIALHTIKVQNWDKTITMIPTHKLLETSFKNWRGMFKSGGRRIKRSIPINVSSVRLCDDQMLEQFEKFDYITDYIRQKRDEVARYNQERGVDTRELINGRRLTNLGTFRAYIEGYLRHHPQIRQDMTLMVRQLPPGALGLPIEIYVFINDTRWERYEAIQADIFDHILAVVPEFGLSVFQRRTGEDFRWVDSGREK
ncbi:MAG: mechanosensitive ion channel [Candidatus Marinimicrobia bacterium]|nr:mechanosensitive ion channel [Candidatus Neomarinimicrobiota bacterium]